MTTSEGIGVAPPVPGPGRPRSVAHDSLTVAAWTLVSRATGLLRVVVIGAVLGPTFLANAFLATNSVPTFVYSVVAGPVLALVVVPAIVRTLVGGGAEACVLYVRRLSSLLVVASGAVALLLVPVALLLPAVLTAGVPAADRGRAQVITTVLLLLVAPQVLLYTLAALGAAAQQARRRYALAAAAPALENIGLIATMAGIAALHGTGHDVADVPLDVVLLMGVGATLSVGVHAAVQVLGAHRVGLSIRPARGWLTDPQVRAVAGRLRGSVVVTALPTGSLFLLLVSAASMPGGVLVFQMAFAVYTLPIALGARAVTAAVMPRMSAAVKAGDSPRYSAAWRQALTYVAATGLPALCVLVVFAGPIAGILAAGDLWSDALITSLAWCIAILAVAQVASGTHEIGRQALYAHLNVRGPQLAGVLAFTVTAACAAATLLLPAGLPRLAGLSGAVLAADLAAASAVVWGVRRIIRPEQTVDTRALGAVVLAAAGMLPVLAGGSLLTWSAGGALLDLVVMGGTTVLAAGLFALTFRSLNRRGAAA